MTAASTYCHVVGRSEAEIRLAYEKGELVPNVSYLGSLKVKKIQTEEKKKKKIEWKRKRKKNEWNRKRKMPQV